MSAFTRYIVDSDVYKTEKPYIYDGPDIEHFARTNVSFEEVAIPLTDLRTVPDFKPTVETHGFAFVENKSKELPALTDVSNSQPYANEMAEFVKQLLGAEVVIPVNTRLRSADSSHGKVPPGCQAHIDNSPYDIWGRIDAMLTKQEQDLILSGKYRARTANLWRPMINHSEDYPLAVLDPTSIEDIDDIINVDHVSPNSLAELAYPRFNPRHRWYWLSNQTPDEAIFFTQYDTHPPNGMFNHIGHCAFRNEAARPNCPPRQSVEVRFIILEPAPYEKPVTITDPAPNDGRVQPWRAFVSDPPKPKSRPADASQRKMAFGDPHFTAIKVS